MWRLGASFPRRTVVTCIRCPIPNGATINMQLSFRTHGHFGYQHAAIIQWNLPVPQFIIHLFSSTSYQPVSIVPKHAPWQSVDFRDYITDVTVQLHGGPVPNPNNSPLIYFLPPVNSQFQSRPNTQRGDSLGRLLAKLQGLHHRCDGTVTGWFRTQSQQCVHVSQSWCHHGR